MSSKVTKIQIKRGLEANLPTLSAGEPAFTTDQKNFYIGDGSINQRYLKTTGDTMIGTNSTTFFQIQQADTTPVFNVDTTNRKIVVTSGTSGQSIIGSGLVINNDAGNATQDDFTVKSNTLTVITVDASADALGFFNATPVSQQSYTAVSNPPTQAEVTAIRDALVNLGLMASS